MGTVNATTIATGSIVNSDIAVGAAIETSKLTHQHVFTIDFNLDDADTPVTTDVTFYIPTGNTTIKEVKAWLVDTGTSTDIDFDLHVNGLSVLVGAVNVTDADSDQTPTNATIASALVTGGNWLTAKMDVTTSTGALGPRMQIVVDSSPV